LYAGEHPPSVDQIDWLIIMGGSMSVAEEERYPWLAAEKTFIRQAIYQGKRVLGICLGAQLIANVLGRRTNHHDGDSFGGWTNFLNFVNDKDLTPFHYHLNSL